MLLAKLSFEGSEPTTVLNDDHGTLCWPIAGVRHAKDVSIRRNFVKEQNFYFAGVHKHASVSLI